MPLIDTTQLALERAIQGAGVRQEALTANLANVDTPGYVRKDVDFHAQLAGAMQAGPDAAARLRATGFAPTADSPGAMRADGGTVDADVESARLAQNALEHQALVTVAGARLDVLRAAMGIA